MQRPGLFWLARSVCKKVHTEQANQRRGRPTLSFGQARAGSWWSVLRGQHRKKVLITTTTVVHYSSIFCCQGANGPRRTRSEKREIEANMQRECKIYTCIGTSIYKYIAQHTVYPVLHFDSSQPERIGWTQTCVCSFSSPPLRTRSPYTLVALDFMLDSSRLPARIHGPRK